MVENIHFLEKKTAQAIATSPGNGGCTHVVHGRSRVTIDPRIPATPGRNTSGFYRSGSAVGYSARRLKGELPLGGGTHLLLALVL